MAERALRGMRIGAHSMETEANVEFAPRIQAHYKCPAGHEFDMTFSEDAEVPAVWVCKCSAEALLENAEWPEPTKPARKQRTHWDMLRERREIEDLEVLLEERLELLRAGRLRRRSA